MNKLEQMRASDNVEDAVDDYDSVFENPKKKNDLDSFKEDYFTLYSDIKISIKEDW
ncbi:MAG: hypothetical protein R3Y18_01660 [Bacillota bacterium]